MRRENRGCRICRRELIDVEVWQPRLKNSSSPPRQRVVVKTNASINFQRDLSSRTSGCGVAPRIPLTATVESPPTVHPLRLLQFRTFRGRLTLIAVVLAASFLIVLQANRRHAMRQIEANLQSGSRVFATLTERRPDELTEQARLLAYDYGFKQAFSVLVSLEKNVLYNSDQPERDGTPFDLPGLIAAAEGDPTMEGRGLMLRVGQLFAVVVVPLLAPEPIAWICLGFRIDDAFAKELGILTKQEVTFLNEKAGPPPWTIVASTLGPGPSPPAACGPRARGRRRFRRGNENSRWKRTVRDADRTAPGPQRKGRGRPAAQS